MRRLVGLWRRSLRTRVVINTVLLSTAVILIVGWALLHDVAGGLAENRRDAAIGEARAGLEQAQSQLDAAVDSEPTRQSPALTQLVDALAATRGENRSYELVLQGPLAEAGGAPVRASGNVGIDAVPADLVRQVSSEQGIFWTFSELSVFGTGDVPVVTVGGRVTAPGSNDRYALYYVFSMADQQETLGLVRTALLAGGAGLLVMVTLVAGLVARQVVEPVRLARRIAERFAAGNLEQRMHVKGEDDIARLSTSFNQMAESLQSQIRRLENLSRLQQRFVSDVSHELRTPLTTVQMAGQVLYEARPGFDPQTARAAELLQTEVGRFEALLSDLLDLSRFDAGAATLETDPVDLAAVARTAAADDVLKRAGIVGHARGADRPAIVEADYRRVDRIVRNLVTNAARYSESDQVDVIVSQAADRVSLAVRDYGVGMEPDVVRRVFDRFWRGDPARSHGGTGLGLAIAREDAALHGGTLEVWSRPGEGTEFILTLPRVAGERVWSPVTSSVFA
ncbi:HAMP domain-containing protein [Aeromicrobium sp. 636]|uniref:Sensor histidine kinase MtrB n=1 Tax=Aeromicrobium senzhongii TaxID=2663859 RepID=A0A8I0ESS3_9ACTN|nr:MULTISPECIES: MtrAB system histidine kinase MtrB [Aeromicrobium]MBC9225766.1 HAMP domain-containing histidine kinase [Aeromicrobium senzhongii]MCQ3997875.1 HAMP domain-containing protein [Aeromicrobium sp. 636]MTB87803.1 HAMP domain-containing protein [Aeromicrobium senzhongii]QNL95174.1 HAMP domain-containing histidine kinase [Aeromicrobium senzhongii]